MKEHSVSEGSEQDLLLLGKALGMVESTPGDILSALIQSVCTMDDDGGSALIETASLRSGATICGVESGNGQVHVGVAASTKSTTDHNTEGDDDFTSEKPLEGGYSEYAALQEKIRHGGFSQPSKEEEDVASMAAVSGLAADESAAALWKSQMYGSLVAGFRVAIRAGPICEEPLRGILVVLEGVEVGMVSTESGYKSAKPLSGGMVVSALNTGIRCALLYVFLCGGRVVCGLEKPTMEPAF